VPKLKIEIVTLTKDVPATGEARFAGNVLADGPIEMVDAQRASPGPPAEPGDRGVDLAAARLRICAAAPSGRGCAAEAGLGAALQHGHPGALL